MRWLRSRSIRRSTWVCVVRYVFQEAPNLLNRNQTNHDDLVADGWLGAKSLTALKALRVADNTHAIR